MKLIPLILGCALIATNGYAQVPSLKIASDKAQTKIDNRSETVNFGIDKLPFVNPFIGTGGHGHTYPGASMPFGMMQLSPDTRHKGWDGCSGYHYSDSIIYGFSHTHLSGTGVSDYGDLLIVPQNGRPRVDPGYSSEKGYGHTFSHENEVATPGFYAVHLDEQNIDARLSITTRAGIHEYTFNNESGKKYILIDLDHRDKLLESKLTVMGDSAVSGTRISKAWASKQQFHFYLETNVPFKKAKRIEKDGRHKLLLIFSKKTEQIKIRVGMSAVDVDGAKNNLDAEIPDFDFEKVKLNAERAWRQELSKIQFVSDNKTVLTNFYTALYHSYLNPNTFNDVDRRYRGYDDNVYTLGTNESEHYTVFSLWDTYRATHPLFTLTQVKRTNAFVNTFLRHFEQGGRIPIWELAGNETGCMIGYHSASVISDAYTKGIRGYNERAALKAMIATSNLDELGKREFAANGFIGVGNEAESVSKTLEYAYDDFTIAQMIEMYSIENESDEFESELAEYRKRSMNFINVYDPSTKFMRGRRSGSWFSPFKPEEVNFNYTEANSWQYSMYAPHAIGVLTDLVGGKDSLENWLDALFQTQSTLSGRHQVDITGLIGQYAHGNEPSHHMAYLYNYTNAPEKTAQYIDQILREMYSNAPDGLSGNEDCGQMSSWYVLSALGLYQVAPGNPYYDFGRPKMNESLIQIESDKKLIIRTINNSEKAIYIDKVMFNSKELKQRYISHEALMQGGRLEFVMSETPSKNYQSYAMAPTIEKIPNSFVPAPYRIEDNRVFEESTTVTFGTALPAKVIYTSDGSDPKTSKSAQTFLTPSISNETESSSTPIDINKTTTFKAFAKDAKGESSVVSFNLVKKDSNVSIEIKSEYSNQYAASGDYTLIDGIRGSTEYRTGDWQGYWAQDLVFEVEFETPQTINSVAVGFLEDTKSWIFLPSLYIVEGSKDGVNFTPFGINALIHTATEDIPANIRDFALSPENKGPYKKIRITAKNYGKCPEWHLGAGNDTWLFVDEVIIK